MQIEIPVNAIAISHSGVDGVARNAVCLSNQRKLANTSTHLITNSSSKDFGKKVNVSVFSTSRSTVDYIESLLKRHDVCKIWAVLDNYTFQEIYDTKDTVDSIKVL